MASSSSSLCRIILLYLLPSCSWLTALGLSPMDSMTSSDPFLRGPHFTSCKSHEQETFRCWWSSGSFQNLSEPGALRVFYLKKSNSISSEWRECPEYSSSVENECYFNKNHTFIWTNYCVELRSQNQNITYDQFCFSVENIVHPDPPVRLNWTLLNVSLSGLHYDIMMSWDPPPSADVKLGWMKLVYEVQYRMKKSTHWDALDVDRYTQQTIYGLHTEDEYEVHVRCRMLGFTNFGDFSDSVFVYVPGGSSKESSFPVTLVLIFGVVGVITLCMLIVFSQQQRLMVVLLPPVPEPKIKGIDPELLKKGKLEELNFILSGGGMGGLHSYSQDLYQDEPWVEFIEVDWKSELEEKEDNQSSDTEHLLALPYPSHHTHLGCTHTLSIPDDDSGRASCYEPDLPEPGALLLMSTLLSSQLHKGEPLLGNQSWVKTPNREVPVFGLAPEVQTQLEETQSCVNVDFYAQVSDITPAGGVMLSPGQQPRSQENSTITEQSAKVKEEKCEEESEAEEWRKRVKQLLVLHPEGGGYTTESSARHVNTPIPPLPREEYQTVPPQSLETTFQQGFFLHPGAVVGEYQSPYIVPESPPALFLPPVSDYTVVQDVDCQHSLLLNPHSPQTPPHGPPQHPTKSNPTIPIDYLSPDLLRETTSPNITGGFVGSNS
ncbi:growth hormone receptor a [Hypomesus transpacificus]|uniref:growth hormone receptor a n=1 Tax=Hypomesus transpacificus TaxID=137520 RepID=UPI001F0868FE|nr:growth hormone receptor a [Hypomesus transpacificus]